MPRWVKNVTDPSARFIKHYAANTDKQSAENNLEK